MAPAYFTRFPSLRMQRDARGILQLQLHTDGDSFKWSTAARTQLMDATQAVGQDRDNRVVILCGSGDSWCAEFDRRPEMGPNPALDLAHRWDQQFWEGRKLLQNLLDIEVPVIAAVHGPALIHSEHILTCDIVLASQAAAFQDLPHLDNGLPPADGVHVLWPHVLGPMRGRYFLLTQQRLSASEALQLGVCQEVLAAERLLPRAYEIAARLAEQPTLTLRSARLSLTQRLKRLLLDELALGMTAETIAALSKTIGK